MTTTQPDVQEPALVAQRDLLGLIDPLCAPGSAPARRTRDVKVWPSASPRTPRQESADEGPGEDGRCCSSRGTDRAVPAAHDIVRRGLLGEPPLLRLVEPLRLPAGLGMVWSGVLVGDHELVQLHLDGAAPAPSGPAGEHRGVVGEDRGREPRAAQAPWKLSTTSPPLVTTLASEATQSRE